MGKVEDNKIKRPVERTIFLEPAIEGLRFLGLGLGLGLGLLDGSILPKGAVEGFWGSGF